ncbi:hypothetical protein IQ06DRAFT_290145 [Phaeosphaeriaceae sp. SRC1lsM3a]|nr:hypothetical protein IQ06DRAFT_290145 [Stagonospora sp. SRC1lsM3a]
MYADHSPDYPNLLPAPAPTCYFSIQVPASSHFSIETPNITPVHEYTTTTFADPSNPLLAFRPAPLEFMSSPSDASRLLQLQTSAAHRPIAEPLQHNTTTSSSSSASGSTSSSSSSRSSSTGMSPSSISCCRCRRESLMGMVQFGTNTYYCSHCSKMVGYTAG